MKVLRLNIETAAGLISTGCTNLAVILFIAGQEMAKFLLGRASSFFRRIVGDPVCCVIML